jgi:very-short-patch-repair endonuclease
LEDRFGHERIRNPKGVRRARRLRQDIGVLETVIWQQLRSRKLGFKFRRQVPVLSYVLDFYCDEAKLNVEIDGPHHLARLDSDEVRDSALASIGITTLRLRSDQIIGGNEPWPNIVFHRCVELSSRHPFEDG